MKLSNLKPHVYIPRIKNLVTSHNKLHHGTNRTVPWCAWKRQSAPFCTAGNDHVSFVDKSLLVAGGRISTDGRPEDSLTPFKFVAMLCIKSSALFETFARRGTT
jgi:hypothetical protein